MLLVFHFLCEALLSLARCIEESVLLSSLQNSGLGWSREFDCWMTHSSLIWLSAPRTVRMYIPLLHYLAVELASSFGDTAHKYLPIIIIIKRDLAVHNTVSWDRYFHTLSVTMVWFEWIHNTENYLSHYTVVWIAAAYAYVTMLIYCMSLSSPPRRRREKLQVHLKEGHNLKNYLVNDPNHKLCLRSLQPQHVSIAYIRNLHLINITGSRIF